MTNRWQQLAPRTRGMVLIAATLEGLLKVVALIDLLRRPADEVNGSKWRWAAAIVLINSAGLVPVLYFKYGRRLRDKGQKAMYA